MVRFFSSLIFTLLLTLVALPARAQFHEPETRNIGHQGMMLHEDYHAKGSCPRLCAKEGLRWTGRWTRESCNCAVAYRPRRGGNEWTLCARENGVCQLPYPATISYGANGRFARKRFGPGAVRCSNSVFGDPLVGVGKSCFIN